MIYTVMDFETTGFSPRTDFIVSASYLSLDEKFRKIASGTMYFDADFMPESSAGALQVHGLTKKFLSQYKDQFEENTRKLYKLLYRGNIVTYNGDRFDIPFAQKWFERLGLLDKKSKASNEYIEIPIDNTYDMMKIIKPLNIVDGKPKTLKLHEAAEKFGIGKNQSALYEAYFGEELKEEAFHTSQYDTFVTAMLFMQCAVKGYIQLNK